MELNRVINLNAPKNTLPSSITATAITKESIASAVPSTILPILLPPAVSPAILCSVNSEGSFLSNEVFEGTFDRSGTLTFPNKAIVQGKFFRNDQGIIFVSKATLTLPDGARFFLEPRSSLTQLRKLAVTSLPDLITLFGKPINIPLDISPFVRDFNYSELPPIAYTELTRLFQNVFSTTEYQTRLDDFLSHINSRVIMPEENTLLIKKALSQIWRIFQCLPKSGQEHFSSIMLSIFSDLRCGPDVTRTILDLAREMSLTSSSQESQISSLEVSLISETSSHARRVIQDLFESINRFFGNMPDDQSTHQMSGLEYMVDDRFGALGHSTRPDPFIPNSLFASTVVELLVKDQFTMESLVKLLPENFITDWGNPFILELAERDGFDLSDPPDNWKELPLRFFEADATGNLHLSYLGLQTLLSRLFSEKGVSEAPPVPIDGLAQAVANRIQTKTLIPYEVALKTFGEPGRDFKILFRMSMPDLIPILANSSDLNQTWEFLNQKHPNLCPLFLQTLAFTAEPNHFEAFVQANIISVFLILINPNNIKLLTFLAQHNGNALYYIFKFLDPSLVTNILDVRLPELHNRTIAHVLARFQVNALAQIFNKNPHFIAHPERIKDILKLTDSNGHTVAHILAEFHGATLAQILNTYTEFVISVLVLRDLNNWTVAHILAERNGDSLTKIINTNSYFKVHHDLVKYVFGFRSNGNWTVAHILAEQRGDLLAQFFKAHPELVIYILMLRDFDDWTVAHVLAQKQGEALAQILDAHPSETPNILAIKAGEDGPSIADFIRKFNSPVLRRFLMD